MKMNTTFKKDELQQLAIDFMCSIKEANKGEINRLLLKIGELPNLSDRYVQVLTMRDGKRFTYTEMGEKLGLTSERARQIYYRAHQHIEEATEGIIRIWGTSEKL